MASVSNLGFVVLNFYIFSISLFLLLVRGYFDADHGVFSCEKAVGNPIVMGIIVCGASMLVLWYPLVNHKSRIWIYFCELSVTLAILVCFAFAVVPKDYNNWDGIKQTCLVDLNSSICPTTLGGESLDVTQSVCCKPPVECGFEYKNGTIWIAPSSGPISDNSDCDTWSNDQDKLCYDCNSCKARIIGDIKDDWIGVATILGFLLFMLASMLLIGCCIRTDIQRDDIMLFGLCRLLVCDEEAAAAAGAGRIR